MTKISRRRFSIGAPTGTLDGPSILTRHVNFVDASKDESDHAGEVASSLEKGDQCPKPDGSVVWFQGVSNWLAEPSRVSASSSLKRSRCDMDCDATPRKDGD
jgi:hypothetical protein